MTKPYDINFEPIGIRTPKEALEGYIQIRNKTILACLNTIAVQINGRYDGTPLSIDITETIDMEQADVIKSILELKGWDTTIKLNRTWRTQIILKEMNHPEYRERPW